MNSTTYNLPQGATLSVRFFQKSETDQFTVTRMNETKGQIGQSYLADWKTDKGDRKIFLKIPDQTTAERRDELRVRFEGEMRRGMELNNLIQIKPKGSRTKSNINSEFALPRFVAAGEILSVTTKSISSDVQITEWNGTPFVAYEWVEGKQLDELLEDPTSAELIRQAWFTFARGLTRVVKQLHNHGFLHASIAPRNILYDKRRNTFYLAGFGYASLCIDDPSRPLADQTERAYQAPEFLQGRSLDALWHAADIYSIGAVLYYVATGRKPAELPDSDNPAGLRNLKREVRTQIENSKVAAFSQNDNVAKIIDNCIRFDSSARFETAEELLNAIDIAETGPISSSNKRPKDVQLGPFFVGVLDQRRHELKELLKAIEHRAHYEIYGSRTTIIEGLCRMITSLPNGAVYRTVSLPSYWTSNNLGPDGRFLAMNKYVARRGVRVERIFLVNGPIHSLPDHEQEIVKCQALACKDSLQVRVRITKPEDVFNFERSGQAVAFIAFEAEDLDNLNEFKTVKGRFLCLNFISRGQEKMRYGKPVIERQIRKVRVWDPARGDVYFERFQREAAEFDRLWPLQTSRKAADYINPSSGRSLEDLLKSSRCSTNLEAQAAI